MTSHDTETARVLGVKDLDIIEDLQKEVLASLPEDQDVLHIKTRDDFTKILQDPDKCVIGVDNGSNLAAMSVIVEPTQDNPDADILDFPLPDEPGKLTTLSSVMVRPDLQGGNLMTAMLDFWRDRAERLGRNQLLSIVTRSNTPSWHSFLKTGLQVIDAGIDKIDGSSVYLIHKDLEQSNCPQCKSCTSAFNLAARPVPVSDKMPLSALRGLLRVGFRGAHAERSANDNRPTGRLVMYHKSALKCDCN